MITLEKLYYNKKVVLGKLSRMKPLKTHKKLKAYDGKHFTRRIESIFTEYSIQSIRRGESVCFVEQPKINDITRLGYGETNYISMKRGENKKFSWTDFLAAIAEREKSLNRDLDQLNKDIDNYYMYISMINYVKQIKKGLSGAGYEFREAFRQELRYI